MLPRSSTWGAMAGALVVAVALIVVSSPATAVTYDVTQGGVWLGAIAPFASAETGADFYRFGIPQTYSGGPLGVPLSDDRSILYVHRDTNTGLYSLGWIHGLEGEGPLRYMQGMVELSPDSGSPGVLVSDDPASLRLYDEDHLGALLDEFFGSGGGGLTFLGNWRWGPNRTDGGVVGAIGTTPGVGGATVTITDYDNAGDLDWYAASANGSLIPLTAEEGNAVHLTATPELPPLALGSLAMPLVWLRGRLRRGKGK